MMTVNFKQLMEIKNWAVDYEIKSNVHNKRVEYLIIGDDE